MIDIKKLIQDRNIEIYSLFNLGYRQSHLAYLYQLGVRQIKRIIHEQRNIANKPDNA